jgi:hypothetical protein
MQRNSNNKKQKKDKIDPKSMREYKLKILNMFQGARAIEAIETLSREENMTKNYVIQWLLALGIESYERGLYRNYGKVPELFRFVARDQEAFKAHFPNTKVPLKRKSSFIRERIRHVCKNQEYRQQLIKNHPEIFVYDGKTHSADGYEMNDYTFWYVNMSKEANWEKFPLHLWEKAHNKEKKNKS